MKKIKIQIKLYDILAAKVGESCAYAANRIYKHTDFPSKETIEQTFYDAVTQGLTEVIDFEDEDV